MPFSLQMHLIDLHPLGHLQLDLSKFSQWMEFQSCFHGVTSECQHYQHQLGHHKTAELLHGISPLGFPKQLQGKYAFTLSLYTFAITQGGKTVLDQMLTVTYH